MSHPRIAEVDEADDSDLDAASDPDEMDVDAFDFARPQQGTLSAAAAAAAAQRAAPTSSTASPLTTTGLPPAPASEKERLRLAAEHRERAKAYQCLYPCYFDSARTRARGRRVSAAQAVANPLARGLVDALQAVGHELGVPLQIVFEPNKQHPDDWANPGRVRVLVKREGEAVNRGIRNKHHLYNLVAAHLQKSPTTVDDPLKLRLHGMPPVNEPPPPPAVPRGFRINKILPLHSPALSGGGVSDNMFKDMMAEMEGIAPGAAGNAGALGAPGGAGGKRIKEKKKK